MGEVQRSLNMYRFHYICDECNEGEMVWTHHNKLDDHGLFEGHIHCCEECDTQMLLSMCYPRTTHEEGVLEMEDALDKKVNAAMDRVGDRPEDYTIEQQLEGLDLIISFFTKLKKKVSAPGSVTRVHGVLESFRPMLLGSSPGAVRYQRMMQSGPMVHEVVVLEHEVNPEINEEDSGV